MPTSHDDLLTPTELEAAQLMATLAWRLDGGQLVSADQMLARLCGIPTNDVAMASIVLLRQVAHSVAPALQRPPIESLITCACGSPAERERPANVPPFQVQAAARFCRRSAPLTCTKPHGLVSP